MSLSELVQNDPTDKAVHIRKLIASDHPVLKTVKRLIYDGKNNMQARGMLILLLSHSITDAPVSNEQRKLAEIVEMIHAAQCIHKSIVDTPTNSDQNFVEGLQNIEYGNKISVLGGDYLLANALVGMSTFGIPKIIDLVAHAIVEFIEGEFMCKEDMDGNKVPSEDTIDITYWEKQWKLSAGSLLSAGYESSMLLAKQPQDIQIAAKNLGLHTALAIQAYDEIRIFSHSSGNQFSLCSAPVIFHLQEDRELLHYIQQFQDDLSQVDYNKVFNAVIGSNGLEKAKELCEEHVDESLKYLKEFPDNDGRKAYEKLLSALLRK